MIEVSVIMPAFNAEKYISESIESVLHQTYPYWELIVIDDGSTDKTREIIESYTEKDARIKYIWQKNGRQGKARNNGLRNAKGKYIAFLDSDDIWLPNKLEAQLTEIKEQNVDLIFSDTYVFRSLPLDNPHKMNTIVGHFYGEDAILKMLEMNRVPILTVLVKIDAIIKVSGFTEKKEIQNAEDYHLWLKLLISGFIFYGSPNTFTAYRVHPESVTDGKFTFKETIEMILDLVKMYPKYRKIAYPFLKLWFIRYYEDQNIWDSKSSKKFISEYCTYLNKEKYIIWLYFLQSIIGLKLSKKVFNRLIRSPYHFI